MICTCDADGVRAVEASRIRIFKRMGLADMRDLATAIVLSLAWDFGAEAWIGADMWFGVALATPLVPDGLSIECDWPWDGLAALWEQLAERCPERVTVREQSAVEARVAERISAAMLAQYEAAYAVYDAHREAAHDGPNDCPPCEDCSVLMTLYINARHSLAEAWGSRDLEDAMEQAFR